MAMEVRDAMFDEVLDRKLKTPEGRTSAAKHMANYLRDVARYGSEKLLSSEPHDKMCKRAAKVLDAIVHSDLEKLEKQEDKSGS